MIVCCTSGIVFSGYYFMWTVSSNGWFYIVPCKSLWEMTFSCISTNFMSYDFFQYLMYLDSYREL
uniref:Uncharacterized protein n=1 Tax=Rhizophora mucronata TaxID=61149 RepID=A0A2P2P9L0_RHIMU